MHYNVHLVIESSEEEKPLVFMLLHYSFTEFCKGHFFAEYLLFIVNS